MSAEDFQLLLKQLNHGLAEVERQKKNFGDLNQKVKVLEANADRDPESKEKILALQKYQQSERYVILREKAEQELFQLQKQCGLLQEKARAEDAHLMKDNSHASEDNSSIPVIKNNRRNYI